MKKITEEEKDNVIVKLAQALHEAESDYIHMKRRYDALWHVAISEYDADPSILLHEVTKRYLEKRVFQVPQ